MPANRTYSEGQLQQIVERARRDERSELFEDQFEKFRTHIQDLENTLNRRLERLELMNPPELTKAESEAVPKMAQAYLWGVQDAEKKRDWKKTWAARFAVVVAGLGYLHGIQADTWILAQLRHVFH